MKKKLISLVLVIALALSLAVPALAALPNTMSEERQAELKEELKGIITGYTQTIAGLAGGFLDDTTVKDLVKGMITGLLDPSNLGGTVGSLIGDLIGGAIGGSLGFDLPDFDLGGIIDGIVANDIVNAILTSDFLARVIDKSIDNILDSIDIMDIAIDILTVGMIDQLTEEIWNNGNPSTTLIIGNWNNSSSSWNTIGIGLTMGAKLVGSLFTGGIEDYIDFNNIDWMALLPDWDVLLGAIWDAVVDTAIEYFEEFKADLIAQVRAAIDGIIWQAKDMLAKEINKFFCKEVVNADMTCEEMQCAIEAALCDMVKDAKAEMREAIKDAITAKLCELKKQVHSCIHGFIDKLIAKCCKCCDDDTRVVGKINLRKTVLENGETVFIINWLLSKGLKDDEILAILEDITFEFYYSDADGTEGALADTGGVNLSGVIESDHHDLPAGWYLIREVLGDLASDYFKEKADDLLVYFDGHVVSVGSGKAALIFDDSSTFTIKQYTAAEVRRPVQVLYSQDGGATTSFWLRTTPKLDPTILGLPSTPNGGGALDTFKFDATDNNGVRYQSFCADIGAVGVRGNYVIDKTNHGLTAAQMRSMAAAIDYIYDQYGFGDDENYSEGIALAQLVVWNLIIKYSDDPSIADAWIRNSGGHWLYTDAFGKIYKIEGYNNTSGTGYWYTPGYKELINDIITDTEKYVDIYDAKLGDALGTYVSDAFFLVGDKSSPSYYQQRQLVILFDDPVTFENEPPVIIIGKINIDKLVLDNGKKELIITWLLSEGINPLEILVILEDITFEFYNSDADGNKYGLADTGAITYSGVIESDHDLPAGWYLVHEVLGEIAGAIFQDDIDDLLIYFDGDETVTGAGVSSQTIPEGATFTIGQFTTMDVRRTIQVLYSEDGGATISFELRTEPKLDPAAFGVVSTPNGGGALDTFKFEATDNDGNVYQSFCADIGALGVRGTYVVDETNHGLDDEHMHNLVAAIDYIYSEYGFGDSDEYSEGIALAQLIIWNYVIRYSDDPIIANAWILGNDKGWLYTDAYGEIFKVEGYNNTSGSRYWYTPEYKALINDILDNIGYYVDLYDAKVAKGADAYVSDAVFLIGDGSSPSYLQQRQLIVLFSEPFGFVNEPVIEKVGLINIKKMVLDGNDSALIIDWLRSEGYEPFEIMDILSDISFELYYSDEYGSKGAFADVGGVDFSGVITFSKQVPKGWYLVHEVLGDLASTLFEDVPDLHVYFGEDTDPDGNDVFILCGDDGEFDPAFYNDPIDIPGKGNIKVKAQIKEYEDVYKRVPKTKTVNDTLVTYVGNGADDKKSAGGYNQYGDYIDNSQGGFTAVAINVNGPNDRVFVISKSGHGNPKFQNDNDKIALTYTVEVVDGNVIMTFDENFVSASIAIGIYNNVSEIKWAPGQYSVTKGNVNNTTGVIEFALPENAGEVVYLAVHTSSVTFYTGEFDTVFDGQRLIPYTGTMALSISDIDGFNVYFANDLADRIGKHGRISFTISDEFDPGEYMCVLSGSGFESQTRFVQVVDGQTAIVEFDLIEINKAT